jgi:hypothetical protein
MVTYKWVEGSTSVEISFYKYLQEYGIDLKKKSIHTCDQFKKNTLTKLK